MNLSIKNILVLLIMLLSVTTSFAEYDTLGRQQDSVALWAIRGVNPKLAAGKWADTTIAPIDWYGVGGDDLFGRVENLYLENCGIDSLPPEIGSFANDTLFIYINLSNNAITSLPPEIGNLTTLTNIDLSHNKLTSLPEEFGNLINLETINFSDNDISILPETVLNIDKINYFSSDGCFYNNRLVYGQNNGTVGDSALEWLYKYFDDWIDSQQESNSISKDKSVLKNGSSEFSFHQTPTSIKFSNKLPNGTKIKINTLNGKTVFQKIISGKSLDISHLAKGKYLIKIEGGSATKSFKVDIR